MCVCVCVKRERRKMRRKVTEGDKGRGTPSEMQKNRDLERKREK